MSGVYSIIEKKLHRFIRKYYYNELIKGGILFIALGLLYLLFVLWVEDLLWLGTGWRTALFVLFVTVEAGLLLYYVVRPVFRLMGFSSGIAPEQASRLIGKHFPDIDDKLLNLLQLHQLSDREELVLASVEQKAEQLRPFPFHRAINFSANKKYLKYLFIPLIIWSLFYLSGKTRDLSESYKRITHPKEVFVPPAPFKFLLEGNSFKINENSDFTLRVITNGESIPDEVIIHKGEEIYYMKSEGPGKYYFHFPAVKNSFDFFLEGGGVQSPYYTVEVLPIPKITNISLRLDYPAYTGKKDEQIHHTGNALVPEGTLIKWKVETRDTDSLNYLSDSILHKFSSQSGGIFVFSRRILKPEDYYLDAANRFVNTHEKLPFNLRIIYDEHPKMTLHTDIDSLSYGPAQFAGQVSDDYGIAKLQLVYYPRSNPKNKLRFNLTPTGSSTLATFYYKFPEGLDLIPGKDYELYFEVFDNDAINGSKSTKSKTFSYHLNSPAEQKQIMLQEEKQKLEEMEKNLQKQRENRQNLENLQKELQEKPRMDYDDAKKLRELIQRQERYQNMMQRQTEQIQENLHRQSLPDNPMLQEKLEDINKRIEEFKDLENEQKLLEELQRMAEKMQREELVDKIKKMSANHKQKQKSLEQLLELTKRFYVEQKQQQIIDKLNELAEKQEKLAQSPENTPAKQDSLNKQFENISKEIKDLQKENDKLKEPMDIDPHEQDQEQIKQEQQQASEKLQNKQTQQASKNQNQAAKKMRKMAQGMQMQMAASSKEMIEEDIEMLRRIIDNLIVFSYDQEDLMLLFEEKGRDTPGYAEKLKQQYRLKAFFEHIDDSLYVLAMRQPKISQKINEPLSRAHYYLPEAIKNLTDFRMVKATTDQQYVMTAANDLALLLSLLLDNMQSSLGMGQGQGQGQGMGKGQGTGKGFQLPDIIKKQGELGEKMQQEGSKPGDKQGEEGKQGKGDKGKQGEQPSGQQGQNTNGGTGNGTSEKQMQELYEIYKQQALLRQAMEKQLEDLKGSAAEPQARKVKKQMEELERMLLEEGITQDVLNKLRNLQHQLLKLKKAVNEQGIEQKRQSKTNQKTWERPSPAEIRFKKKYLREDEILNREPLPLKDLYRKKVQEYFQSDKPQ